MQRKDLVDQVVPFVLFYHPFEALLLELVIHQVIS
jgi:hypothetical protein